MAPKFPKSAKINSFEISDATEVSLLCDAQAFPAPVFRFVISAKAEHEGLFDGKFNKYFYDANVTAQSP